MKHSIAWTNIEDVTETNAPSSTEENLHSSSEDLSEVAPNTSSSDFHENPSEIFSAKDYIKYQYKNILLWLFLVIVIVALMMGGIRSLKNNYSADIFTPSIPEELGADHDDSILGVKNSGNSFLKSLGELGSKTPIAATPEKTEGDTQNTKTSDGIMTDAIPIDVTPFSDQELDKEISALIPSNDPKTAEDYNHGTEMKTQDTKTQQAGKQIQKNPYTGDQEQLHDAAWLDRAWLDSGVDLKTLTKNEKKKSGIGSSVQSSSGQITKTGPAETMLFSLLASVVLSWMIMRRRRA